MPSRKQKQAKPKAALKEPKAPKRPSDEYMILGICERLEKSNNPNAKYAIHHLKKALAWIVPEEEHSDDTELE